MVIINDSEDSKENSRVFCEEMCCFNAITCYSTSFRFIDILLIIVQLERIVVYQRCIPSLAGREIPVSIFIRCMLFLSSYFPLWIIIVIVFHKDQPIVALISLCLGIIGLFWMFVYFLRTLSRLSPIQGKIESRQSKGGDVMGYVASYVVPFVTFPLGGWEQIASLAIFVVVLGIIYVGSDDMLRINPTLNIFLRYHLYEVTMEHSKDSCALITRRYIKSGDTIYFVDVGNGIFLEKKK